MKTSALYASGLAIALLLTVGSFIAGEAYYAPAAFAQDATPAPTTGPEATAVVQTAPPVERENNDFPWGLLGLLGLGGLAGLRSRPEPVRHEPAQGASKVGVYDSTKK